MLPEGLQDCVLIANFSLKSTLGLLKKKKKKKTENFGINEDAPSVL